MVQANSPVQRRQEVLMKLKAAVELFDWLCVKVYDGLKF